MLLTAEVWRWLLLLLSVAVGVTIRTVQGMARVRSGQAPAWPLPSDQSVRSGSRVKRSVYIHHAIFTCGCRPAVIVTLEAGGWRLEGRTRTLSRPFLGYEPSQDS
jgi:hypothetical protein